MQMPEMDGLALAAALRRLQGRSELPMILLTSLGGLDEGQRKIAQALGLAATLTKPIKPAQIYETLVALFTGCPVQFQPQEAIHPETLDAEMGRRLPLRILLVDDNSTNQRLGVRLLERLGYRADVVANGAEALEMLRRQPHDHQYQVVLMDVQMPVMDGLEATQHIRRELPHEVQPYIIAMTANALAEEQEECRVARMDDYVGKPIRIGSLVAALQRAAEHFHPALRSTDKIDRVPTEETHQTPASTDAIDEIALARLQEMMGGDPAHLHELIAGFLEDAPQLVSGLRRGLETGDVASVQLAAHTLKSNAADFGAMRLRAYAQTLEQIAKAGSLEDASGLVDQIEDAYTVVQQALQRRRDGVYGAG
jgi:CheY-like chemotaxis protein/HPt (histidine-containing phosphotransfer) domain-containing protein